MNFNILVVEVLYVFDIIFILFMYYWDKLLKYFVLNYMCMMDLYFKKLYVFDILYFFCNKKKVVFVLLGNNEKMYRILDV